MECFGGSSKSILAGRACGVARKLHASRMTLRWGRKKLRSGDVKVDDRKATIGLTKVDFY